MTTETRKRNRYPGAHPFTDDPLSSLLFHGRKLESLSLINAIVANRLVVLFARSGIGKTSLLNAGVAEQLRLRGFLPLIVRINNTDVGALESMYQGIEATCKRQNIEYKPGDKTSPWHFFKTAEFWSKEQLLEPVIVLDQFEELFTLQLESHRSHFLDQLSYLVRGIRPDPIDDGMDGTTDAMLSDSPPCAKVVLSLREDFLACLDEMSNRIPEIFWHRHRLLPLTREAAEKALLEPAAIKDALLSTQPFKIDPRLKNTILDFLTRRKASDVPHPSDSVEPFQLQLICQYLEDIASKKQYDQKPGWDIVTLDDFGRESKLHAILKKFYLRQVKAVPFLQRGGVRRLLSEFLIGSSRRRLVMEESEIKSQLGVKPSTLQILVDRRLLRAEQTANGKFYELSHDSLIQSVLRSRRWPFLGKMIGKLVLMGAIAWIGFAVLAGLSESGLAKLEREVEASIFGNIVGFGVGFVLILWFIVRIVFKKAREIKALWGRLRV